MSLLVATRYVVISQGEIPLYKRIIDAAFFTALVFCVMQMVYEYRINVMYLYGAGFFLYYGFKFSHYRNFVFDFKKNRFREEIQISILKFGFWDTMPELRYIPICFFSIPNGAYVAVYISGIFSAHFLYKLI
jgi:hypothetical protein